MHLGFDLATALVVARLFLRSLDIIYLGKQGVSNFKNDVRHNCAKFAWFVKWYKTLFCKNIKNITLSIRYFVYVGIFLSLLHVTKYNRREF